MSEDLERLINIYGFDAGHEIHRQQQADLMLHLRQILAREKRLIDLLPNDYFDGTEDDE